MENEPTSIGNSAAFPQNIWPRNCHSIANGLSRFTQIEPRNTSTSAYPTTAFIRCQSMPTLAMGEGIPQNRKPQTLPESKRSLLYQRPIPPQSIHLPAPFNAVARKSAKPDRGLQHIL